MGNCLPDVHARRRLGTRSAITPRAFFENLKLMGKPFAHGAMGVDEPFFSRIKTIRQPLDLGLQLSKARRAPRYFFEKGNVAKGRSPERTNESIEASCRHVSMTQDFSEQVAARLKHRAAHSKTMHFDFLYFAPPHAPCRSR